MKTDTGHPVSAPSSGQTLWQRVFRWPGTRPGWWSVGLAGAFVLLMIINSAILMRLPEEVTWRVTILPFYGIFMLLCGLSAGIVGLIAVIRQRERSWLVWMPLLFGLNVIVFVLGEFLFPH